MKGFFYHNIILVKTNLLAIISFETLIAAAWILLTVFMRNQAVIVDNEIALIGLISVFTSFLLLEVFMMDLFEKCEQDNWCSFAMATPPATRGYIGAKYELILMEDILVVIMWTLLDAISGAIYENMIMNSMTALIMCAVQLLFQSIELVSIVRFGNAAGSYCKWGFLGLILFGVLTYGLFGNISLFQQENMWATLLESLSEGVALWAIALLPYAGLTFYFISYKLSVRLFRKGVEGYEP